MWILQESYHQKSVINMEECVKQQGYPLEKFSVTTKDGYVNTVYRIRHGKNGDNNNTTRPAVVLSHGMICNSATFLVGNNLAFYLVEGGFDVWLPNNRGTSFSNKHADFDAEKEKDKYWNFSFHEIAIYDLTAFIDFVLEQTGHEKLCHIGFSQGCTAFAIMAAELPEYNEKISLSISFGSPIVFNNISVFPTKLNIYGAILLCQILEKVFRMKIYEIPVIRLLRFLMAYAEKNTLMRKVVEYVCWQILGHKDHYQLQELDIPRMSLTCPDTACIHQLWHYSQMIRSGRFAKYDYGAEKNMKLYGSKIPPLYDLSKVTAPVIIFYGKNDMYNNYRKDKLNELMGNVVHEHIIDYDRYNHVDFLFAKDNMDLVYTHALKYMKKYCIEKNKTN